MKIIIGATRGPAVIGPGYIRDLNSEQLEAAKKLSGEPVQGTDRAFDVWKAIATQGQVTKSS